MEFLSSAIQQVTDLTNEEGQQPTDSSRSDKVADEAFDIDEATKEDMIEELQRLQGELRKVRGQWEGLQQESQGIQDEYSAYKTKVSTWREQMKASRQQDRKTIELLRGEVNKLQSGGNGEGSADAAKPSGSEGASQIDGTYTQGLEDQVRTLKETVREYGNERDKLELELQKVKKKAAVDIEKAVEQAAAAAAASSGATSASDGGATTNVAHETEQLIKKAAKVDQLEDETERLKKQVKQLENTVDELSEEATRSNDALVDATQKHRAEVRELEAMRDKDKQLQYIKGLERELAQWRKQQSAKNKQPSPDATIGEGSMEDVAAVGVMDADNLTPNRHSRSTQDITGIAETPEPSTPGASLPQSSPASRFPDSEASHNSNSIGATSITHLSQLEGKITLLQEKVAHKDETIAKLDGLIAELQAEKALKEANIDSLYDEGNELRERMEELTQQLALEKGSKNDTDKKIAKLEEQLHAAKEEMLEVSESEAIATRNSTKAQRDVAERNETIRLLKQDILKLKSAGSPAAAAGKDSATAGNSTTAIAVDAAGPTAGAASPAAEDPYALNFNFAQSTFGQTALSMEQVKTMWQSMMSKQKKVFSVARSRMYVAISVLVALIVLFAFYQSGSIMEDDNMVEQFAQCKEQLKNMKLVARMGTGAGGGVALPSGVPNSVVGAS